jgi:hypothetical protein
VCVVNIRNHFLWVLCLGASTGMSIDYVALARLDRRVGLLGLVSFVSEIEFIIQCNRLV